ncbi:MAG: tetratricopeptide repeat protein [Kofleriaceae bacterium]
MSSQAIKVVGFLGVLGVATYFIVTKVGKDPDRDRANRIEAVIKDARSSEAGAKAFEEMFVSPDFALVPAQTQQRAGVEAIRIAASRAGSDKVDAANRLVRRYQLLPAGAREDAVLGEVLTTLDGWADAIKTDEGDARIAILRQAKLVADSRHQADISKELATAKLEVARQKTASAPLEALALFVEEPVASTSIAEAGTLLAQLVEAPSLLEEAGRDLDAWLAATKDAPLRTKITEQRELATAVRAESEGEKTPAELAAMQKKRPWDQRVAIRLALQDLDEGKVDAAAARLEAFGKPSLLVRDGRMLLARIAMQQGKLDVADDLVSSMLGSRLQAFVGASAAFEQAALALQASIEDRLKTGALPPDVIRKLETASEAQQREIVDEWITQTMRADTNVTEKRETMIALGDVVSASIFAGTIKVQRAQALTGAARDTMLAAAEKTFLAVRTAAEGQPEFHLGLGEIYARLGKVAESDKEFQSVLDRKEDPLTIAVANIYRNIGNPERATKLMTEMHERATDPKVKYSAAFMLYHLARNDEEQAKWLKASDPTSESVKIGLLELEANNLRKKGDFAACDKKFAEAAKAHLDLAARSEAGYNNAAIAHMSRYACSGDVASLVDAEKVLDRAYRAASDSPIVVSNYASLLVANAYTRVIAKRIDSKAIKLTQGDAHALIAMLREGGEREAVLADLNADPAYRKSAQLFGQLEVLQPNSASAYSAAFAHAKFTRDDAAGAAVVARLARVPKLDTSDTATSRAEFIAGKSDKRIAAELDTEIARLEPFVTAKGLSPRTQAAAAFLLSAALLRRGAAFGEPDRLAKALALDAVVEKGWPGLQNHGGAHTLVDMIGLELDKERWSKERRERTGAGILDLLAVKNDPLLAKIKAHAKWPQIAPLLRAITLRPNVSDLRLARQTGDADAIAKTSPVLDDKLVRIEREFDKIADPSDPASVEDLTFLDKR